MADLPVPVARPGTQLIDTGLLDQDGNRLYKAVSDTVEGVSPQGAPDFFTPGQPQKPLGPFSLRGRWLDYPVARNINTNTKDEGVLYPQLRALARYHDITRLLIETRKDQLAAVDWSFQPKFENEDDKEKGPSDDQKMRIEKLNEFFAFPDGEHTYRQWQRMLLEDVLVIDAPCIYINNTEPGATYFEILDGTTIRRVIDTQGRMPQPPSPAFQQIIHGLPAWNFTRDEVVWFPRNPGPDRIYGFSPVEQIVLTVNIALRRQYSQLQYFTEGNIPDALIAVPKEWTPQQILAYQEAWDAIHEGNTAERRHARFVPGEAKITQTREVILKNEFDEWLARVCCYAFSIPPTAFVKQMNRATAGTAKEAAEEEGLGPLMDYWKEFVDILIQRELGQYDLEFKWAEKDDSDPDVQSKIIDRRVRNGTMTINEARAEDGRDPIEGGDIPMIYMGPAPTPVKLAAEVEAPEPQPGNMAPPGSQPVGEQPSGKPPGAGSGKQPPGQQTAPGAQQKPDNSPQNGNDEKAEVGKHSHRPFDVTKALARKEDVDYSVGKEEAHCGICEHYVQGRSPTGVGTCEKVEGQVQLSMWCELFKLKTTKVAKARGKRFTPHRPNRVLMKRAENRTYATILKAFKTTAKHVAAQIAQRALKADDDDLNWVEDVDLSGLSLLAREINLADVAGDASKQSLAQIGVHGEDSIVGANERAEKWAKDRAAEMVGMKWVDGELVDNPNADWDIDESTRSWLRDTVADGMAGGKGWAEIAKDIEGMPTHEDDTGVFSMGRARTIARTEVMRANGAGAVEGYKQAKDMGINIKKEWIADDEACDDCLGNEDDGPIDVDDSFSTGDDAPPAHPNCECSVVPYVEDEPSSDDEDTPDLD